MAFHLSQNYHNSFNPSTTVRFKLPKTARVTQKIYNTPVQIERTLCIQWDGKNIQGNNVASDIYLYKLETNNFIKTYKMILLQ